MSTYKWIVRTKRYLRSDGGQGFTEYGLILGAVAVAVILVLVVFGTQVNGIHQKNANAVNNVATSSN